jgi:hypothetical protein
LVFRVQESADLGAWNHLNLSQQLIGIPQTMGAGIEYVTVRGILPASGANALPRGFPRVMLEKP